MKISKTKKCLILIIMLICSLFSSSFTMEAYIKRHDASSGIVEYGAGIYSLTQENCTGSPVFTQELETGWNEVNFSTANLSCCVSDHPAAIFESIYEEVDWIFENITYKNWNKDELGNTLHHILPNVLHWVKVFENCTLIVPFDNITVYRTVSASTEKNNFSSIPLYNHSGNVTLKVPVSSNVRGIINVTNDTCGTIATEVNNTCELVNNTFWYDSVNQYVHIRTINLSYATVTYYFDDYDSGGEEWSNNPENMVDGNEVTEANDGGTENVQLLNSTTCPGTDLGTIQRVEVRSKVRDFLSGDKYHNIRPVFSAGDGDVHNYTETTTLAWSSWFDITTDTNAPSSWTWTNVTNLDCDIYGSGAGIHYCSIVQIRVTYMYIFVNWTINCSYGLPTNFTANTISISTINLTWTKGNFTSHTYIVRKTGGYPISRTDGTNIYNDTGITFLDDDLSPAVTYYYSAWGYNTTWGYSEIYTNVSNYTGPANPSNVDYILVGFDLNISWTMGQNANTTVIQRKTDSYPTNSTDGTNIYNSSGLYYVDTNVLQTYYYTLFSWDNTTDLYSTGINLEWNVLYINCYDEETNDSLYFDVFISNQDGSQSYESLNNTNTLYIGISQLPTGDDVKITVSAASNYSEKSEVSYWSVDENYTITYIVLSQTADSKSSTNVTCINESDGHHSYPPFTLDGDLITILPDNADDFTKIFVNYTHEEYSSRLYYRDIGTIGFDTLNAYLPPTEDKQLYLLEVIDEADNTIDDVYIEVKRNVNGTFVVVSRLLTDANGQADVNLISNKDYIFIISKEGYITENASWTPGTLIFTHTFRIIWETTPFEPDTFGDIITFYGNLYENNTLRVTFYDLDDGMTDSHFIVYEDYNNTLTYMGEYNGTTSNDIVFWINVTNATRLHIIVLYMNHSTLGEVIDYRIVVYPVHVDREGGTWLENLIISVVGEFDYGYVLTCLWFFPCVILIAGLGAIGHPGIGILGAGMYSIWITWNITLPEEAKILAFASIAIVTGFITLVLVKGKDVIH